MSTAESVRITVDGGEAATLEEREELTLSLRSDLLDLGLESVDRADQPVLPEGAKAGTAHTIGVLVASGVFSASTMKAIATVTAAWLGRTGARSVSIARGDHQLEITGASRDQTEAIVEEWFRQHSDGPREGRQQEDH